MNIKYKLRFATLLTCLLPLASCQSTEQEITWVDYGEVPMANPSFLTDWMATGAPGEEHQRMASLAGDWTVSGRMWMTPDAEPEPSSATATSRLILGGRYLLQEYKSEFAGMPYEGLLIQGYDNIKQEYFSIWMDNMSTVPAFSHGERIGSVTDLEGVMRDVLTPSGRPMRTVVTEVSTDEFTMEMYDSLKDGTKFRTMELTYTR